MHWSLSPLDFIDFAWDLNLKIDSLTSCQSGRPPYQMGSPPKDGICKGANYEAPWNGAKIKPGTVELLKAI